MRPEIELLVTQRPAEAAGERLARAVERAVAEGGRCRLAIPGGSALAALPLAVKDMSAETWAKVLLTWVDERCVPRAAGESNRGALEGLGLPAPQRVLPLWEEEDVEGRVAVERVSARLSREFAGGLDVLLLGLGEDGHVASLFPGDTALLAEGSVVWVPESPKPPKRRISLTLSTLATAPEAVMLAGGAGKQAALRRVLRREAGLPTNALPRLVIATDVDPRSQSDG